MEYHLSEGKTTGAENVSILSSNGFGNDVSFWPFPRRVAVEQSHKFVQRVHGQVSLVYLSRDTVRLKQPTFFDFGILTSVQVENFVI